MNDLLSACSKSISANACRRCQRKAQPDRVARQISAIGGEILPPRSRRYPFTKGTGMVCLPAMGQDIRYDPG